MAFEQPTPRVMRRATKGLIVVALFSLVALELSPIIGHVSGNVSKCVVVASAGLALVYAILGFARYRARWRKRASKYQDLLCLNCGYCLKGLGEVGRCPECGQCFDVTEVKATWRDLDS